MSSPMTSPRRFLRTVHDLILGSSSLSLGRRTAVMGILNVTPDSFSDGGSFFDSDLAVAHGEKLAHDGADIIDIGGESTRPFSDAVSADEEIRRTEPVIKQLVKRVSIPISIDTTKAAVARCALDAGACMINDVSSLRFDPDNHTSNRKVSYVNTIATFNLRSFSGSGMTEKYVISK